MKDEGGSEEKEDRRGKGIIDHEACIRSRCARAKAEIRNSGRGRHRRFSISRTADGRERIFLLAYAPKRPRPRICILTDARSPPRKMNRDCFHPRASF